MVELRRAKSRIQLGLTLWTLSLELARLSGWNPAGTRRTDPTSGKSIDALQDVRHLVGWPNEYRFSDGQTVADADAVQLADSLTRAAANTDRLIDELTSGKMLPVPGIRTEGRGYHWFTTPEGKTLLHNLAEFCRGGAFQIL
jgi:hypothetical protein